MTKTDYSKGSLVASIWSKLNFFNKKTNEKILEKLSNPKLKILEDNTNNEWVKETLIYTFEYISKIYINNLINENNKANIVYDLKSYFEYCLEFLENLYKDKFNNFRIKESSKESSKVQSKEEDKEYNKSISNINLKKLYCLAFIRVYLKVFIDWINKNKLTKSSEIEEIIIIINGKETNPFRDMIQYFIYKIIYHMNEQDISKLFDEKIIDKFHLNSYYNFDLLEMEKNKFQDPKEILFIEAYKNDDIEYKIYEEEFDKLSCYLNNSDDKESELEELINRNSLDIFYSVFSTKISAHLSEFLDDDDDQIKILRNFIQNTFSGKEKLLNIFELFLNKSKYTKAEITPRIAEILQFSLRFF